MRERMLWVALGVVSLLLAAALGLATSQLTKAPIGLSAEPVSAGEALAPQATGEATAEPSATSTARKRKRKQQPDRAQTPEPATATATAAPAATADDNSAARGGSGSSSGGSGSSSGGSGGSSGDDD